MPVRHIIHLIQHLHLAIQLIPNLDAQIPLPPDTDSQPIQLLVLIPYNIAMVLMNLHVIEMALIWRGRIGRVIAVGKERGAVGGFLGVGRRGVGEADGFGGILRRGLLEASEGRGLGLGGYGGRGGEVRF